MLQSPKQIEAACSVGFYTVYYEGKGLDFINKRKKVEAATGEVHQVTLCWILFASEIPVLLEGEKKIPTGSIKFPFLLLLAYIF